MKTIDEVLDLFDKRQGATVEEVNTIKDKYKELIQEIGTHQRLHCFIDSIVDMSGANALDVPQSALLSVFFNGVLMGIEMEKQ